jgi:ATP-dependent DNA helicase RecG
VVPFNIIVDPLDNDNFIVFLSLNKNVMSEQELDKILSQAAALKAETEIIEFKEAKEGYDFDKLGKYFSALSNEANLKGKPFAWLIFGVENKQHRIIGSRYRPERKDLDKLKKEIADKTTNNLTFIEIHELHKPEGRVIMFQIPAAPQDIPVAYEGFYYGRANESLVALNIEKIDRIRNQVLNRDWSKNITPDATLEHLDKEALLKAREQYKKKHPKLAKDVDNWNDELFLDKASITIEWILKDAPGGYERFHTGFGRRRDSLRPSATVLSQSVFGKCNGEFEYD